MHPSFKLTVHIFVLPYIVPDDDDEEINLLTYLQYFKYSHTTDMNISESDC